MNTQRIHGLNNTLAHIAKSAEKQMEETKNPEEYAFLFGHVNLACALGTCLNEVTNNIGQMTIDYNYKRTLKNYKDTKAEFEKENEKFHQLSFKELFPELFEMFKEVAKTISNKTEPKKKPSKQNTKKE